MKTLLHPSNCHPEQLSLNHALLSTAESREKPQQLMQYQRFFQDLRQAYSQVTPELADFRPHPCGYMYRRLGKNGVWIGIKFYHRVPQVVLQLRFNDSKADLAVLGQIKKELLGQIEAYNKNTVYWKDSLNIFQVTKDLRGLGRIEDVRSWQLIHSNIALWLNYFYSRFSNIAHGSARPLLTQETLE